MLPATKPAPMAMKGRLPSDEIAALPSETDVFHVEQLSVPDLAAERCLVWMRRKVLAGAGSGGTAEA